MPVASTSNLVYNTDLSLSFPSGYRLVTLYMRFALRSIHLISTVSPVQHLLIDRPAFTQEYHRLMRVRHQSCYLSAIPDQGNINEPNA